MVNVRVHPRREVSIETRLLLRFDPPRVMRCRIIDVSKGGVRVEIDVRYSLPPQVFIMRGEDENIHECRTVWQLDRTAGLKFIEVCGHGKSQKLLAEVRDARIIDGDDWKRS
jgi:hypothetical protein